VIPPGFAGVRYSLFFGGTRDNHVYGEGLHVQWPWNSVQLYDIRLTSHNYTVNALSLGGLSITVDVTVFSVLVFESLARLNREIGPGYYEKLIEPAVNGGVRDVVGKVTGDQLHLIANQELENKVLDQVIAEFPGDVVRITKVIIKRVVLPEKINAAIDQKLAEEQRAQSYTYILQSVEAEASRKRIEAAGIRDFQAIVGASLTPALLTWRGIQATLELSQSSNAKVVIIGNSSKELPVILGSDLFKAADVNPSPGEKSGHGSTDAEPKPADTQPTPRSEPAVPGLSLPSMLSLPLDAFHWRPTPAAPWPPEPGGKP
jgi:regulator of protease activity HflC (stomatin/prohibitin superfamily)